MTYEEAKKSKMLIEEKCVALGAELKKLREKFSESNMGLISEEGRLSPEYRKAKHQYDLAFRELQIFNSWFIKSFKKQYQAERRNRIGG